MGALEVRQEFRGGVPVSVCEQPAPIAAGMVFRIGWADEKLTNHGITHLVEHLALFEASTLRLPVNGSVGPTLTSLLVRGTEREVVEAIASICRSLRALPMERLENEANVLRTEKAWTRAGSYGSMLDWRFGARSYGLAAYPEYALFDPKPDAVNDWARRAFTIDNLAVWSTAPLPDGVEFDLPRGQRLVAPSATPIVSTTPAWFRLADNAMVMSTVVQPGPLSWLTVELLERRLHQRLRLRDGLSYSVGSNVEEWSNDTAHVLLAADCLPEHGESVRDALLAEVARLALNGPDQHEIDDVVDQLVAAYSDPTSAAGAAYNAAARIVAAREPSSAAQVVATLSTTTPEAVRQTARTLSDDLIYGVGCDLGMYDRRVIAISGWSNSSVEGRAFVRGPRLADETADDRIIVGPAGVTLDRGPDRRVTVLGSELVGVVRYRNAARLLYGSDGFRIVLHAEEWVDGAALIALVDQFTNEEVVVNLDVDNESLYLREVEQSQPAKPKSRWQRRRS